MSDPPNMDTDDVGKFNTQRLLERAERAEGELADIKSFHALAVEELNKRKTENVTLRKALGRVIDRARNPLTSQVNMLITVANNALGETQT